MKYLKTSAFAIFPRFRCRLFLALSVITAAVGVSDRSLAQPPIVAQLPDATFSLTVTPYQTASTPGTLTGIFNEPAGTSLTSTAMINQGLDPYVSASVVNVGVPAGFGTNVISTAATAQYEYYFEIMGGAGSTANVTISASGSATAANFFSQATAQFTVGTASSLLINENDNVTSATTVPFTIDNSIAVPLNTLISVVLYTFASDAGPGTTSSYVDPQISLDADQSGDTLIFSPNFLPVPEPSAGAMLVLGGASLLGVRRFRGRFSEVGTARCAVRAPSGRKIPAALPPGTSQRDVPTNTFTTTDVYAFERELEKLHPDISKADVKASKIRQQLQVLPPSPCFGATRRGAGLPYEREGLAAQVVKKFAVNIEKTRREILKEITPIFLPGDNE